MVEIEFRSCEEHKIDCREMLLSTAMEKIYTVVCMYTRARTSQDMDGGLTLIFCKSKTRRDIKK